MAGLFISIGILVVLVMFGLLPFVNFWVLPLKKKDLKKDEEGKFILDEVKQPGIASFEETEKGFVIKRAEGVERMSIVLYFKRGILCFKKRYELELAQDEITLPKPAKGVLFALYVTKLDGKFKNIKKAYDASRLFLIVQTVLQFVALFTWSLIYSISIDYATFIEAHSEMFGVYFWPIVISLLIVTVAFFAQDIFLRVKGPRKEVK